MIQSPDIWCDSGWCVPAVLPPAPSKGERPLAFVRLDWRCCGLTCGEHGGPWTRPAGAGLDGWIGVTFRLMSSFLHVFVPDASVWNRRTPCVFRAELMQAHHGAMSLDAPVEVTLWGWAR
jgi:hypothetical protein